MQMNYCNTVSDIPLAPRGQTRCVAVSAGTENRLICAKHRPHPPAGRRALLAKTTQAPGNPVQGRADGQQPQPERPPCAETRAVRGKTPAVALDLRHDASELRRRDGALDGELVVPHHVDAVRGNAAHAMEHEDIPRRGRGDGAWRERERPRVVATKEHDVAPAHAP